MQIEIASFLRNADGGFDYPALVFSVFLAFIALVVIWYLRCVEKQDGFCLLGLAITAIP